MICCLNPDCPNPENPDGNNICQSCQTPLIPLLRGRYRVTRLLSKDGGFGRTYLAEDIDKLNEICVVKQLAPKVQTARVLSKAKQLFEAEAKLLQQLGENPQIPTLLAYFEQDNNLYLVQQFIDGQNLLKDLQQRKKYNEKEIREFLLDLLPVLKFIHQRQVIHRDIKPENIMHRNSDGRLVLIDFGASKELSETVQSKPGTTIGTNGYSPIEQIRNGEAYPASDLFALGATCFHLLTGVSSFQLWTMQGYSWIPNWQQYLTSPISSDLANVLDKLLKINIQERYQSADEVIKDLIPQPTPVNNNKRKNPLLVGGAILILGIGGLYWWKSHSSRPPVIPVIDNSSLLKTLSGHSNVVTSVALSPDGKTLASGSWDTTLQLWDLATGKKLNTLEGNSGRLYTVSISSDGNTVASGSGQNTIKLWNLVTKQELGILQGHSNAVKSITFSQDGQTLVSGNFDGSIKVWNLSTRQEIKTLQGHSQQVKSVAISSDGKTLVSGSGDNSIKLWNIISGQNRTLSGHSSSVNAIAISPDGIILASGSADKTIKMWNLPSGQESQTLKGHSYAVNAIAFSPDGTILASGSADHTVKLWNTASGQQIRTLQGHTKEVTSIAFSPDGNTLASGSVDQTVKIWRVYP
ncbi:serine/threonine-protein kinase [Iningainema tapete]|uniref:Serine/threonine protein kinase n=1 Tax=Iningainema tapete BLCC-T55 TaxID=2748662 RepID=A0A8J6XR68_9CYAN|nr:serine/threonine-protein kinase [Iningainema tapete]MBD2777731.1 serine/threonine protein kinase [Iningainema tapete BLCC-T55]